MSNTPLRFLGSRTFWAWCLVTLGGAGIFFGWELRVLPLPYELPRPPATTFELIYTAALALFLGLAAGLFGWQRRYGSCPVGVKRAMGCAGALGGLALLCPVCLALPAALLGLSALIALLGQFLPLIRLLAFVVVLAAVWMLWPRTPSPSSPVR